MEIDWNNIKFEYEPESNLISFIEVEEMIQGLPTTMEVDTNETFLRCNEIKFENIQDIIEEIDDDVDYKEPEFDHIQQSNNQQIQSVESLYMCSICSLDFPSIAYLKRHNNTKKHQRAFEMAQRGKKFNQKKKYVRKNEVKSKNYAALESRYENSINENFQNTNDNIKTGQYLMDNQELSQNNSNLAPKQEVIAHEVIMNQLESQNQFRSNLQTENHLQNIGDQSQLQMEYYVQPQSQIPSSQPILPVIYCQPCNKYFKLRCHFTQHVNSVHSGAKNFKCQTCGKKYETKDRLEKHMVRHTVGNKPFKCTKCDRSYINKIDLKRHEKTHRGVKDHTCKICGNGFVRLDHLEKHYAIHQRMISMGMGVATRKQKNAMKNL